MMDIEEALQRDEEARQKRKGDKGIT